MVYWAGRLGKHPQLPTTVAKLLKDQNGKCKYYGLTFREGDLWEVDHIIPSSLRGENGYSNLQLLNPHCHYHKTASDGSQYGSDNS
jgi:RNA-directed DNA polymerase